MAILHGEDICKGYDMIRNKMTTVLLISGMLVVNGVYANDWYQEDYRQKSDYYDYAKVVDIKPLYKIVEVSVPRQECRDEKRVEYNRHHDSFTPTIIGSILGGVIGNRFGKGKGKTVATVAGTLLGGSIARDIHNNGHRNNPYVNEYTYTERHCRTVNDVTEQERLDGYQVSYRYKGVIYTTRMGNKPGKRIRLHVALTPVD